MPVPQTNKLFSKTRVVNLFQQLINDFYCIIEQTMVLKFAKNKFLKSHLNYMSLYATFVIFDA